MLTWRTTNPAALAWAAGFFDGEGTFTARKGVAAGNREARYFQAAVTQKHPELIIQFADIFAGLGRTYFYEPRPHHCSEAKFMANSREAFVIAYLMWPWLGERKKADFKRSLSRVLATRPLRGQLSCVG